MKLQPLDNRVLIRPVEAQTKSTGGILLPEGARKKPSKGIVLAVGPGPLLADGARAAMQVRVGQTVYYSEWTGAEIEEGGEMVRVLVESDILAVADHPGNSSITGV